MIVNDRIDIALAVQASGVHVGQSDMPVSVTRKLLPANTIIGVSCNNTQEIEKAVQDGADYVGIGSVWATSTKNLDKPIIGGWLIHAFGNESLLIICSSRGRGNATATGWDYD